MSCYTRLTGFRQKEGARGPYKEFRFTSKHTDGVRRVQIRLFPSSARESKVWVHCSCPYFLYHLEYALASKKASSIINCNGQFPSATNPRLRPYLCKHLYASSVYIIAFLRGRISEGRLNDLLKRSQGRLKYTKETPTEKIHRVRRVKVY